MIKKQTEEQENREIWAKYCDCICGKLHLTAGYPKDRVWETLPYCIYAIPDPPFPLLRICVIWWAS